MRRALSSVVSVLAIAGALVVLLALVSSLVAEEGSADVAKEGKLAIVAEATLSSTSAVRNAAAQTLILERGRSQTWVDAAAVDRAVGQLSLLNGEFRRRSGQLLLELEGEEAETLAAVTAAYSSDVDAMIEALAAPAGTSPRITNLPTDSYDAAVASLVDIRDSRVVSVLVVAEYAGQAADVVRFLVIVVIPVIVLLLLRRVLQRRREGEALQTELAHERAINSSKDEFVANLSHELRTPLTGVYGFALALDEMGFEDEESARELTDLIVNDAAELSRMVDDLITAGQVETGNVTFDIAELPIEPEIHAVIEPFQRAGNNVVFAGTDETAEVDRLRFRQVLRNLVSNAVKHGGPNIEIFTEHSGTTVSVFVMDDGAGIPEDKVTTVFERYQHEGSGPLLEGSVGLGLAIAKSLANGMEGDLTYTRTAGQTYFVLKLPSHKVARLNERVEDLSLGDDQAAASAYEVAKLFAR